MKGSFFLICCLLSTLAFGRDLSDPLQTPFSETYEQIDYRIGSTLYIDGEIHDEQWERLESGDFKGVDTVVLNSRGGSGPGGIKFAQVVRKQGLTTVVPAGAVCMSACMFIFQAGVKRVAYSSSVFMFHGPRLYAQTLINHELCDDKGREHCYEKAIEDGFKEAIRLMEVGNDNQIGIYELMENLGAFKSFSDLYRSLPLLDDKSLWLEEGNFYLRPNLYFASKVDTDHQGFNKLVAHDVIKPFTDLITYNVVTELR